MAGKNKTLFRAALTLFKLYEKELLAISDAQVLYPPAPMPPPCPPPPVLFTRATTFLRPPAPVLAVTSPRELVDSPPPLLTTPYHPVADTCLLPRGTGAHGQVT